MAIGIVSCVLIFPETMNHWYLETVCGLLGGLKNYGLLQSEILNYNSDDLLEDKDGIVTKSATARQGLLMMLQARE